MRNSTTEIVINEFAVRSDLLRRTLDRHRTWIEKELGVSLADAVILETDPDIAQIGNELILAIPSVQRTPSSISRRLRPFVLDATTPPDFPPLCEIRKSPRTENLLAWLGAQSKPQKSRFSWQDCPVALHVRWQEREFAFVALNIAYHPGPGSDYETTARLIVARRENASEVVGLLEHLDRRDNKPRLHVCA
jgi:hypothetical protein